MELWSRKLSTAELAKVRQSEIDRADDTKASNCVSCQIGALECLDARTTSNAPKSCMRSFRRCLSNANVSPNQCPL